MTVKVVTKREFSAEIEDLVRYKKVDSYMDAVLFMCENGVCEIADVPRLINQTIRDKIEVEGSRLNMLPPIEELPV